MFVCIFSNISMQESIYKTLFSSATIGIVLVNKEGKIVAINPFGLQQFGYTQHKDLEYQSISILIPERFKKNHHTYHEQYMAKPINRPMGIGRDLKAIRKDGTEFAVEISLSNCIINNETFVLAFVNDITKRKEAENALQQLNESLEQTIGERTQVLELTVTKLNEQIAENLQKDQELRDLLAKEKELGELKSRFVSMASHEFRTPLSAVLSSTYLLSKYTTTEDNNKREKHIQRIITSVNTLNDILNDLLSVSKIEEGKIQVKPSLFNIEEFIATIVKEFGIVKKENQVIYYVHSGSNIFSTDATLLKHCCLNLLSNAVKFSSDNGSIEVKSSINVDNNLLTIQFLDNGIGISQEDMQQLFERFFRAANAANVQGTGLGLHIVQKYVELLRGTIDCESKLNEGTLFTIKIPTITSL
jgi:PAS domain S-box-containing protein